VRAGILVNLQGLKFDLSGAGAKNLQISVSPIVIKTAVNSLSRPTEFYFEEDSSVQSDSSLTKVMAELKFLSSDSKKSNVPESVAEYRRNLENLLQLPKYNYIHDYYQMADAIKELELRWKDESNKKTRDLLEKVIEHLKIVHKNG
jgi:hypothetical protein